MVKPDFVKLEKDWFLRWQKNNLLPKYLQKNKNAKKKFSFLDGPITANNPMGVHHAWGRTLKDFFQRYKNMSGFKQRFQNGFDNQGLWVEVEVEKELGFKTKKDIEKYGIAKFVEKCKERTLKFAKVQTEQSKRLGYFMDWDHSYYTLSDENNYAIWHFLKKCWQDGNLYKGRDSVPWCPRCGTAISQHEILTEEYQLLTHESVYFKLPIINKKNESFLVWTTTPWTIPANVALAVNPKLKYQLVEKDGLRFWLVDSLIRKIFGSQAKILKEVEGKDLVGLRYVGPFAQLPAALQAKKEKPKTFHTVVDSEELVSGQEGTGIVHLAPGAGGEDFQLGAKKDLPVIAIIGEDASYLAGFADLSGKNAKKNPHLILDHLLLKDFIFKIESFTHRYPVCWRCKTELVWRVVEEWYIAMDDSHYSGAKNYRQKMMTVAKKARWIPDFGLKRELDWLKNMEDWLISKKRYWGLALPIWECSCGHFEVIGSKEELKKRAFQGWGKFNGHTPHRPWVDQVKIKCPNCGKLASRIADVGNPWLDAGIVSFSTLPAEWFPADFVTESFPGQFKNWFYSLIAMATVLKNTPPFKNLLGYALVKDEKGEEMHKSKGNAIEFNDGAQIMGVDVMRWLYLSQNPKLNLNFGFNIGDKVRRRFHLLLWNIYLFSQIKKLKKKTVENKNILDKWILSKLNRLIKEVTKSLDNFDTFTASYLIEDFVNDLSIWYIRRSRKRDCYVTLSEVLLTLTKLLAPFIPFLSEEIYQDFGKKESVHLERWPEVNERLINQKLELQMEQVRKICELGHAARKEAKIRVRQPLAKCQVLSIKYQVSSELIQLIKEELNIKKVIFKRGKGKLKVKLDTQITPELRAEGEARELVRQIQDLRKKAKYSLDQKIIVYAPNLPKNKTLKEYLKKQTLADKLVPAKTLRVACV